MLTPHAILVMQMEFEVERSGAPCNTHTAHTKIVTTHGAHTHTHTHKIDDTHGTHKPVNTQGTQTKGTHTGHIHT